MTRREQFDVEGPNRLEIDTTSGSIEVLVGDPGRVVVTIVASNDDRWDITRVGDTTSVRPPSQWRRRSARVVAEVPPHTDVAIRTVAADTVLTGALGVTRVHAVSGDVRIDTVRAVDLTTTSGDVRVGAVDADTSANTVSGDVLVGSIDGRLSATTASGDVVVDRLGGDAEIGTTSGDVRIARFDGDNAGVKCVSGDIHIGLPSGIRVEPDLSTLSGRTVLPPPRPPVDAATPRRTVRLRIKSVSGDIRITRASDT